MKNLCKIVVLLLLAGVVSGLRAETIEQRASWKHEIRVGWGDQIFETLVWHPTTIITSASPAQAFAYKDDFTYYQHSFISYEYRHNRWFSVGVLADLSGVSWTNVQRNGCGEIISSDPDQYFFNAVVMPTLNFTYFRHPYVNLYSGLGIGMCVNTGTEKNLAGKNTMVAPAFNLTLLGVSLNYERYFLSVEYGGMYALLNTNYIFMAKSRMFAASIGVRF